MMRVRIFIDHANFERSWRREANSNPRTLDWGKLPGAIMARLKQIDYLSGEVMEHRGTTVYASTHPRPNRADSEEEDRLRFVIDQLPGYTVKFSQRQLQKSKCKRGHVTEEYIEKGVDTKIACDLLAAAIRDAYDIGVLVSNDADLIPSIECVQDVLDRRIVHAGLGDACQYIRSAAWAHIPLSCAIDDLRLDPVGAPGVPKPANSGGSTIRAAMEKALSNAD